MLGFSSSLLFAEVLTLVSANSSVDVSETTNSCHVFLGLVSPCFGLMGPVGVMIVNETGIEDCGIF